MRFNYEMSTHFRDCTLIAEAYDSHRERFVTLHILPGNEECVGITDGTDAWLCPVVVDAFGINIAKARSDVRDGKPPVRRQQRKARKILLEDQPVAAPKSRRAVLVEA